MNREDLGRFIADIRDKKRLTQQDVVDLTEGQISLSTIARIEAGKDNVSFNKLLSVLRVLEIDMSYLSPEERFLYCFMQQNQ